MAEFDSQVPFTELKQRCTAILKLKVKKDKIPFDLNGSQAIFVMKPCQGTDDFLGEPVIIKRTPGYPNGPVGGWPAGEIDYFTLPPPGGGTPLLWGMKITLKPTDLHVDLCVGQYYVQVDIIPTDQTDRFIALQGYVDLKATGIKEL